jgi:hypothetical protein
VIQGFLDLDCLHLFIGNLFTQVPPICEWDIEIVKEGDILESL